jgi:hypothetical protein
MAIDRKISDLDNLPGLQFTPPQDGDYFLIAREDVNNYKLSYTRLADQMRKDVVFTTGDQTIEGQKTFDEAIIGNLEGYSKYVRNGLYITGDQEVGGIKTFTEFILGNISGNLSGTAQYVVSGVYQTGDQTIYGVKSFEDDIFISGKSLDSHIKYVISNSNSDLSDKISSGVFVTGDQYISGIKSFDSFISGNVSGNLSGTALYVQSGVYTSGDQSIEGRKDFQGDLFISGKPFTDYSTKLSPEDVLVITGHDQVITGKKVFYDSLIPSGGITTTGEERSLLIKDHLTNVGYVPDEALTIAFPSGVYVTGSDFHVEGKIYAGEIESVDSIAGDSGAMVLTDGRDPALFEGPEESLTMAFQSGVFITGSDLHVEGKIYAGEIDAVDSIAGDSGAMVLTDGRDPALFEGPEESLTMAFQSGVFITGSDLHVEGKIYAGEIDAVDSIAGESGSMVLTDGRDPANFEGPDYSLVMAFQSGVYVTGSDFHVEGKIYAGEIDAVDSIAGDSGAMVLTDGRDPANFEGPEESLTLAFQSGVFITGGAGLHVEGKIYAGEIDAVDSLVGESGSMVLTDGRDPANFEGPDSSLTMAFKSGVFITGGAKLNINNDIIVSGKSFLDWQRNTSLEVLDLAQNLNKENISCNFWWGASSKNVFIPLADSSSIKIHNPEATLQSVKLMNYNGRVKKISYSLTKTNPHGIPNPQFKILVGDAVDYECEDKYEDNKLFLINTIGQQVTDPIASSSIQYPEWEDTYHIYRFMGISYPDNSCCYPTAEKNPEWNELNQQIANNPSFLTPEIIKYNTPQQYIVYSHEFDLDIHFQQNQFLAIQMDKGGNEGSECFNGNINQPIIVNVELEEVKIRNSDEGTQGTLKIEDDIIYCAQDVLECGDGTFLSRDPLNNCQFPKCPDDSIIVD